MLQLYEFECVFGFCQLFHEVCGPYKMTLHRLTATLDMACIVIYQLIAVADITFSKLKHVTTKQR